MNTLYVYSLLAGLFFGAWPLMMQRTGLQGNLSATVFAGVAFVVVGLATLKSGFEPLHSVNLPLAFAAGVVGAIGLLCFNNMLAGATRETVTNLFITAIVVQVVVPAAYNMAVTGDLSLRKLLGFAAALATAWLLR